MVIVIIVNVKFAMLRKQIVRLHALNSYYVILYNFKIC